MRDTKLKRGLSPFSVLVCPRFLSLTFLIGNNFDRKSMSASMMSDVVVSNRYLAMLINQRSISTKMAKMQKWGQTTIN